VSSPASTPVIVWFRNDLRLDDHPALEAALQMGGAVLPVYLLEKEAQPGAATRWWLHHSLVALARDLAARGLSLHVEQGEALDLIPVLLKRSGGGAVYWNRRYEPAALRRDAELKAALKAGGVEARSFAGTVLFEPQSVERKQGGPFQVFTPYWRTCGDLGFPEPVRSAELLARKELPAREAELAPIEALGLLPRIPWDGGLRESGTPGEAGARARLKAFMAEGLESYDTGRDLPGIEGVSRLSAHLHFGELSPRRIVAELRRRSRASGVFPDGNGVRRFVDELGWREFALHLLYHFPDTLSRPLRPAFGRFPWAEDPEGALLRAWQRGRTGYPIVDAGMRQLWHTGWMHNRVRMVVGSFLVKHLRLPWQEGVRWFEDTLVDADLASNTLGWQWVAGCGADASPYFRIFNPVTQGERYDAEGAYVRRWVPELGKLPSKYLHAPWTAPREVLERAGVRLGENYPRPIVDHAKARAAALEAFASLKEVH
jgi:deoxyribodipyrimidine photo-lyase